MFGWSASNPWTSEFSSLTPTVPKIGMYEARVIETWVPDGTVGNDPAVGADAAAGPP